MSKGREWAEMQEAEFYEGLLGRGAGDFDMPLITSSPPVEAEEQ